MAIVLTNGTYYVTFDEFIDCSQHTRIRKTRNITKAYSFALISDAIKILKKCTGKTKDFYVFDTFRNRVIWKRMSREEIIQARNEKVLNIRRTNNGKIKRKQYSQETRRFIYNKAGGCCELCGRKLLFEDMTLDHITPLSEGGAEEVGNLACVCYEDNQFKNNILPSEFNQRITKIFLYQMEKKCGNSIRWKIIHRLLNGIC